MGEEESAMQEREGEDSDLGSGGGIFKHHVPIVRV